MRYLLVTYDEANLPSETYDLFASVTNYLEDEGIDCALHEFGRQESVVEQVQSDLLAEGGSAGEQEELAASVLSFQPGDRVRVKDTYHEGSIFYRPGAEGVVLYAKDGYEGGYQVRFDTGGFEPIEGHSGWPENSWGVSARHLERI